MILIAGSSWPIDRIRTKSFEDLHKLWFVLLKEINLVNTQKNEGKRNLVEALDIERFDIRIKKCRISMARIKTVLTERKNTQLLAEALTKGKQEYLATKMRKKINSIKSHHHSFRKCANLKIKRHSLF